MEEHFKDPSCPAKSTSFLLGPKSTFVSPGKACSVHRLEDLLDSEREEGYWKEADQEIRSIGDMIQSHKAEGPYVLGAEPSYTDFFIAGSLQSARMVDEGVYRRIVRYPGYQEVYEACQPYMQKVD